MHKEFFQLTLNQFKERTNIIISFITCFIISILCYGRTFFSAYTPDDYLYNVQKIPLAFFLQQGRFIQGAISFIFNQLNISLTSSGFAFEVLFFASFSICTTYFVYYLTNKNNFLISFILSTAIIISNPIFSTMAAYHGTVIDYTFSFLFLTFFFYYSKQFLEFSSIKDLIIASVSLTLVCGSYQSCVPIAIIWSIFYTLIHYKNYSKYNLCRLYLPIIIGITLYAILYASTKNAAGLNNWDPRVGLITLQGFLDRIHTVITSFALDALTKNQIILKKIGLLIAINITIFAISYRKQSLIRSLLFLLAVFASIIITLLPISIIKIWAPTARSIIGMAFCYGIAFLYVCNNTVIKIINYTFATSIIIFSIIISNAFLYKLHLKNEQDRWLSSNITIALLQINDEDKKEVTIVDNHQRLKSADWAFRGIFYTYTGNLFNFVPANQNDHNQCIKSSIWPQKDSIHIINQKVIICL
ncbi:hypothetical protein CIN_01400 [Commensalibacter intestini A911]|uniref:Glycosyltransferase RgtA/B/C/D-like domain-containing protein n=2 Tax=Commensalibacter intestini TaxID=479936 RepID=A0A251ZUQ3_9PROT|nr:glucosyltransferase domain-containing protein [Commensalibacter intestini]EHD14208.1 hypothetical protein CIN_01400 [Commensalibacter intestini A911]OUI78396.1 hypothetical protein HK18_10225 [Commensalibacter intestini]